MNKYNLLAIMDVGMVITILGIIFIAAYFSNYWLILLLFCLDTSTARKQILKSNNKEEKRK